MSSSRKIIILLFISFFYSFNSFADEIWKESFSVEEKGYWGGGSDMSGITAWSLDASACTLADVNDYIKTVSTSGGRMEAKDIDGEAVWSSELIDISGYTNIVLSVLVSETGSSTNTNKYVKVYYILDGGAETLFADNGENIGNFGSATASQNISSGSNVQIIVRINNPNAGDKTIFDDISVKGTPPDLTPPELISVASVDANNLILKFNEVLDSASAEDIANYAVDQSIGNPQTASLDTDSSIVHLNFTNSLTENTQYSINIQNIKDTSANLLSDTTAYFTYVPFRIDHIFVLDKNNLILQFSRNLDPSSSSTLSNYTVDQSIGNPQSALLQSETNKVLLNFAADFPEDTLLNLHVENLQDENNISIEPTDTLLLWHNTLAYELLFNEIMPDPVPSVALPEYEYLELYNKSNFTICLYNWKLTVGTTDKTFPLINIQPKEYLLICSSAAQDSLKQFGNTVAIMGSSDLTNSGKELALKNTVSTTIDTVYYSVDWYQDPDKDNGGWSLERIDYENTCGHRNNWKAAVDTSGGTPGRENSVYQANIDTLAPELTDMSLLNAHQIQLNFSEELNPSNISDVGNYLLDDSIYPQSALLLDNLQNTVLLDFANDFSIGQHYLKIQNIEDFCTNTEIIDSGFYYYPAFAFDIVINELMLDVNPSPNVLPAAKYIELYNNTDIDISLNSWSINVNGSVYTFDKTLLPAKDYLIVCDEDDAPLFENYGQVKGIISSSKLSTDDGQISLYNAGDELIDYLHYSNTWYANDEKDGGGWSLERIDPLNYCGQSANWKASEDFKGGTPGAQNSVMNNNSDTTNFELINISVLSSAKLLLHFSKNLSEDQALNTQNYNVDNVGNPIFVNFSDSSHAYIILQFANQFHDAYQHTLSLNNLTDFCDHPLTNNSAEFIYYLIHPISAFAENKNILKIKFSEEVEKVIAEQAENYFIEDLGNPYKVYKHSTETNTVYLEFSADFEQAKEYSINIQNVKDLNGNAIRPADLSFMWFPPQETDLLINEVLFNPKSGGVDYVEIFNNSLYPVDLSLLKIANRDDENLIVNQNILSDTNNLLYPSEYLCITTDTLITKNDYPAASYGRFVQLKSFPSYPDDMGTVVLQFGDTIIDEFTYSKEMHAALISDLNGVSLERLSPDVPTQDKTNWYSAAESVGFGTPANKNSQFTTATATTSKEVYIESEVFSPDGDGYNDRVIVRYKFDEPGYIANISVYNKKGQLVKRIANNELLATQGSFAWDGMYENNQRATLGIYIIYFEIFNLNGEVKSYKKTCVVAAKLK